MGYISLGSSRSVGWSTIHQRGFELALLQGYMGHKTRQMSAASASSFVDLSALPV